VWEWVIFKKVTSNPQTGTQMKTYRPTPPLSTRDEVEMITAANAAAAAAPDRLAALLERLAAEAARLADKLPEVAA
jgi:hypothetical protein